MTSKPMRTFNSITNTRHGLMIYNRNDLYVGRSLEIYGEYSELEADFLASLIRPGWTVIDVGANIGALTVPLSKMVGDHGKIIAFEPQPVCHMTLCGNLMLNSLLNVRPVWAACSNRTGQIEVPFLDTFAKQNFGSLSLIGQTGMPIPCVKIDDLGLKPQLIKIDVEGMEPEVLEGAQKTIETCLPLIYMEVDREAPAERAKNWLRARGYSGIWHRPALYNAANYFGNPENVFPNTASLNALCIPACAQVNGSDPELTWFTPLNEPHAAVGDVSAIAESLTPESPARTVAIEEA